MYVNRFGPQKLFHMLDIEPLLAVYRMVLSTCECIVDKLRYRYPKQTTIPVVGPVLNPVPIPVLLLLRHRILFRILDSLPCHYRNWVRLVGDRN